MNRINQTMLSGAAILCAWSTAYAQEVPKKSEVEEIIVTGTRAAGRTALESLTPVDSIAGEELSQRGFPDVAKALQFLEPSVNFARAATTATAANSRPLTLRGLAPDQTLVLINGKRRHATSILNTNNTVGRGSAGVDFDMIPAAAIEHIEVLRDGAAAQYGSDAIAGVINVILKHGDAGNSVVVEGGVTEEGDGEYYSTSGHTGFALPNGGSLLLAAEARKQDKTNRANVDQRFGRVTYWFGDPEVELYNLALNADLPIGPGAAYAFGTLGRKDSTNPGGFRVPGLTPLYPNGFLPKVNPVITDGALTLGWQMEDSAGGKFDISHTYGRTKADFEVFDTANFSLGAQSPTRFNAGATIYEQNVTDVAFSRPFGNFWAGANLAAGLQHRHENYEIVPSEPAAYVGTGADGFAGFNPSTPVDDGRNAYAGFVDIELKPIEPLTIGLAGRYDDYDDFGDATTWKVSMRGELTQSLALRGNVSTGFRAPSLQQQHFSAVAGALSSGRLVTVGTLPVGDPVAKALGATELKPEKSDNYSAGLVFTPLPNLSFSADWFHIEIDDRIALSEQLSGTAVNAILLNAGITNFQQVRFFTNAVDTTTQGFELMSRYNWDATPSTSVRVALGYGRFETQLDTLRANPVLPTLPLLGQKSILYVTKAQPDEKLTFNAEVQGSWWAVQSSVTHFGTYTSMPLVAVQEFGSKTVVDLSLRAEVLHGATLTAGVLNLGDEHPDAINLTGFEASAIASTGGSFPTGEESPIGVNGRTYYLRVGFDF